MAKRKQELNKGAIAAIAVSLIAVTAFAIGISSSNKDDNGDIVGGSSINENLNSSLEDSLPGEESSTEEVTESTYYLVGSFDGADNWMSREYPLEVVSCDDSSVKTQYYLEKEFTADDEIKFTDGNDVWVGYESVENPSSSPITDSNGNIAITASGTFSLYLKVYNDGHHSIWMSNFI